ncbi:MAG TPA: alpha/beta hydrolase [Sphingomonadaceae bacterium]|nr:alpha/beta hydrolase [Sphingomonadaceae bacterium]
MRVELPSGIELAVWDSGPSDGEALVFLHGFPESHRSWRHQVRHFNDRYRCIAPDQRGYGRSSKPQEVEAYTADKLVTDIFQLADALGIQRFTIVGHDWGGAISWPIALMGQASGRVTRAIIADAPHPALFQKLLYTDPVQRAASQYMRGFRDPANDALVREQGLAALLFKLFGARAFPAALEEEERAFMLRSWDDREAAFGMLNWYRAAAIEVPPLDAPYELPAGWTPPMLPKLTIPALVIWATEDHALPTGNIAGLDALVEDLTLVEVEGSGHFVQWEKPAEVIAVMEEFLGRTQE